MKKAEARVRSEWLPMQRTAKYHTSKYKAVNLIREAVGEPNHVFPHLSQPLLNSKDQFAELLLKTQVRVDLERHQPSLKYHQGTRRTHQVLLFLERKNLLENQPRQVKKSKLPETRMWLRTTLNQRKPSSVGLLFVLKMLRNFSVTCFKMKKKSTSFFMRKNFLTLLKSTRKMKVQSRDVTP